MTQPWGKLDAEAGTRHHLAHHCADVAACFHAIARLPAIRNRLEYAACRRISNCEIERLAALVFLHDAGKLHPGFQSRGWPGETWGVTPRGHVREGLEIFLATAADESLPIARSLHLQTLIDWGVKEGLLRAVISHHGRPADQRAFDLADARHGWRPRGPYDPTVAAKAIGDLLPHWFPGAFVDSGPALPRTPAFEHLVCGLTTLADWLGSDPSWFAHVADLDRDYMSRATELARTACTATGLDASRQRGKDRACHVRRAYRIPEPNPQQALVGEVDLDAQVVILEAETGSGKTEAALWHYMRLFEAGRVDGIYFAVPTRSAAVQLHGRVVAAARRVFGEATPDPVLAVPGYIKAGDVTGKPLPHWRVLWDDAADMDRNALAGRWAAEHAKRYLAAQIAVGTVDQALLAALTVKHAHLRAGSLSRSLLVFDEVHASDAYMTSVQKRLLDSHVAIGGAAMLMSATLGATARACWLRQPEPKLDAAVAIPYPAVWTSKEGNAAFAEFSVWPDEGVAMEILQTMAPAATAERARKCAKGARVLVIRNLVGSAIETLQALEARLQPGDEQLLFRVGDVSTLHHSRFAPADRKRLDAAVEAALSTDTNRVPEGQIVIGTQTLEQSLDIDADLLITDLCPVDVLLQRIGRLHRHRLRRPVGFEEPRCIVLVPERGLERLLAPDFENGLGVARAQTGVLQGVYRDLSIIELTRQLVECNAVWAIPEMNRLLVESAVHPEAIAALHKELGPAWEEYRKEVVGSEIGDRLAAQGVLIDRTKLFEKTVFPDGAEERIRTRLGEDNVRIELAEPHPLGPFGEIVNEVLLPGRWCRGIAPADHQAKHVLAAVGIELEFGALSLTYDRMGLRQR